MSTRKTASCGIADARIRLRTAIAYVEVAELVLGEQNREEFSSVAAGLAVLAGIAASDAICCARLKCRHRGDNHREAAELLTTATPDGDRLANTLLRLLDIKDASHYGVEIVAGKRARDAVNWASRITQRAREEVER
jgi:hypothetical protein